MRFSLRALKSEMQKRISKNQAKHQQYNYSNNVRSNRFPKHARKIKSAERIIFSGQQQLRYTSLDIGQPAACCLYCGMILKDSYTLQGNSD